MRSHEREIRGGSTELGATGGSKQAWGSETRIVRAKLRFRATLGVDFRSGTRSNVRGRTRDRHGVKRGRNGLRGVAGASPNYEYEYS